MGAFKDLGHDRTHYGGQRVTEESLRKHRDVEQPVRLRMLKPEQRDV